jgi:hypothetical protein
MPTQPTGADSEAEWAVDDSDIGERVAAPGTTTVPWSGPRVATAGSFAPEVGSIITLARPVTDLNGDELPAELDVVVQAVLDAGRLLVQAGSDDDPDDVAEVDAVIDPDDWYQRPEERRPPYWR